MTGATLSRREGRTKAIEHLAEKLSWPPAEETEEALHLVREIIASSLETIERALADLKEVVEELAFPGTTVVPINLDALRPGSMIELFGVLGPGAPDSAHTNTLWFLLEEVGYVVENIEPFIEELEKYDRRAEEMTADEIRALLAAVPLDLFRAIERQAERMEHPEFVLPAALKRR